MAHGKNLTFPFLVLMICHRQQLSHEQTKTRSFSRLSSLDNRPVGFAPYSCYIFAARSPPVLAASDAGVAGCSHTESAARLGKDRCRADPEECCGLITLKMAYGAGGGAEA
jgi:hypothetical protein